jgi:hypothetical protein
VTVTRPVEWSGWNVSGVMAATPARAAALVGVAEPPARIWLGVVTLTRV